MSDQVFFKQVSLGARTTPLWECGWCYALVRDSDRHKSWHRV